MLWLLLTVVAQRASAQAILQRGYDAGVSGANLQETTLNTSNVNASTFGLLFTLPVDDAVFAQPLYVPDLAVANQGTHDVVFVATMSDKLYAFDADAGGAPLWSVNFATLLGETPVPFGNFVFSGNRNIVGNLGILSTPVIDPDTGILYLVACTLENGTMAYRLHAVDISSGAQTLGPGELIAGSYNGVTFDARYVTQRVSLALSGNHVVFGFGAVELEYPGEGVGWVMSYDKQTLEQDGIFATEPAGNGGGVWQSGRPPVIDGAGYAYVFTGNGYSNGYNGTHNFSESALKLDPNHGLRLVDWFTAGNWSTLDANDLDLTSSGPLLIPGTDLIAGGGKDGVLFVLDTGSLGKYDASDSQIVQSESIAASDIRGGPVYWQRSSGNGGPLLYDWGASDALKAYAFDGSKFGDSPSMQGSGQQRWPGGILALSANGDQHRSGVLWATVVTGGDAENNPPAAGALYAFDAENVSNRLYSSNTNASRDSLGNFGKLVPPLIANGRVYVATWSNRVAVYGLLASFTLSASTLAFGNALLDTAGTPQTVTLSNTGSATLGITGISLSSSGSQPFSQSNTCGSSVSAGGSCKISVVFDPATSGSVSATLSVKSAAGTQTVALSGTGVIPSYTVSPSALSFGSQLANAPSSPQSVTITNTGTVALPITGIGLGAAGQGALPFSQSNTCGASLASSASCTVSVVFTPTAAGAVIATLSIAGGAGAGTQSVALSGTGFIPTYSLSPPTLSFGPQLTNTASAAQAVTLLNTGTVPLPVTGVALSSPGSQPFSQTNNCGGSVAVGGSCTISVSFDPAAPGPIAAMLTVSAGAAASSVNLSGSGSFAVTLSAGAHSVTAGLPVTLSWTSSAGAACTPAGGASGDGWSGALGASGSQTVTESAPGNYQFGLSCTARGVSASATVTVAVTVPTVTLSATPASVDVNKPVTLSWSSRNAASCVASGGQSGDSWASARPLEGSVTILPNQTGTVTYTITCSSGPKSALASATVTVSSPPSSGGGAFDRVTLLVLLSLLLRRVGQGRLRRAPPRRSLPCLCAHPAIKRTARRRRASCQWRSRPSRPSGTRTPAASCRWAG